MKVWLWALWGAVSFGLLGFYGFKIVYADNKEELLIGEATHGHFQIEMACTTCHTEAFGGEDAIQEACVGCHAQELKEARDSHPKKKFTDPRNADRLEIIDARYCVTCHTEHQKEQTGEMGLTLPDDYCFHCHIDIAQERASHKDLAFDSCASAGCHNYHDNRALYEDFLLAHAVGEWVKPNVVLPEPNAAAITAQQTMVNNRELLAVSKIDLNDTQYGEEHKLNNHHWNAGIACGACHGEGEIGGEQWIEQPGIAQCQTCHVYETERYQMGRHGMRLAQGMEPVEPHHSALTFKLASEQVGHDCTVCHAIHVEPSRYAATEACLGCHDDEHSRAFSASPHATLQQSGSTELVECATCHLPVKERIIKGEKRWQVEHNQNANLRPNEKMLREVCLSCHSLSFSIDALADEQLIRNNFNGQPSEHIPSIDWALKREQHATKK